MGTVKNRSGQYLGSADQTVSDALVKKFRPDAHSYEGRGDQTCIEIGAFDV